VAQELPLDAGWPWWMGLAGVGLWASLVVGIVAVARQRQRLRRDRRPQLQHPDPGDDVELY
jgi:hypothetical protein